MSERRTWRLSARDGHSWCWGHAWYVVGPLVRECRTRYTWFTTSVGGTFPMAIQLARCSSSWVMAFCVDPSAISHLRTAESCACRLHGGTQYYPLSAPVKSARTTLSRSQMAGIDQNRFSTFTTQLLAQRALPLFLSADEIQGGRLCGALTTVP